MLSFKQSRNGVLPRSFLLLLGYSAFLSYGSLYPLSGWRTPSTTPWDLILRGGFTIDSRLDVLTNVLIYIPLGVSIAWSLGARLRVHFVILVAGLYGLILSLALEWAQAYLPLRTSSFLDIGLNTLGALTGAVAGYSWADRGEWSRRAASMRREHLLSGALGNLGVSVLLLWALSQLFPLVPSWDPASLRHGLRPLWNTVAGFSSFDFTLAAIHAFFLTSIGLLASTLIKPASSAFTVFAGLTATVFALKVPFLHQQIWGEELLGLVVGLVLTRVLTSASRQTQLRLATLGLVAGVVIDQLHAPPGADFTDFNWLPFRYHFDDILVGTADLLESVWPFLALSYFRILRYPKPTAAAVTGGAMGIFALMFALEWVQQYLPGRTADITDAVLAALAWTLPWLHPALGSRSRESDSTTEQPRSKATHRSSRARFVKNVLLTTAAVASLAGVLMERRAARALGQPSGQGEPRGALANFRTQHPRLPVPTTEDLRRLQKENPGFLSDLEPASPDAPTDFDSAILSAFVEPEDHDLAMLHRELMALEFHRRGHEQVKPIAVAYDWLYDRWSPIQRERLRDKLIEGALYITYYIEEEERLSPYNVILYNSPFQALMAAAIALYREDPRAEPIMAYAHDLLVHRVVPVWRQVMGRRGGWHEGGEYVGIGIGQAIYQVPAMWRKATGEDLFAKEAGIRGFLDFLIYRTRPDGTHFRWGDAGYFDRRVPDRIPLAIEYEHAAAYSMGWCPDHLAPTAWPWGPLPTPELCDAGAIHRMPLVRHFDGVGLVVARSDWTPDATYVTFKAGDNYWSHSHLDQGAFTIYKGGALAIDSGLYGPEYGSDHHMNYTYQTVAHNSITFTDPSDTTPAPGEERVRLIANDGGQRRIGSGWGLENAPCDRNEWTDKRDLYHTGTMEDVYIGDDLVIAVADVTPAYTNRLSGTGSFSDRTRRVEVFGRTFGYDARDDVIIIFDRVRSTRSDFKKRWLLHTIEEPFLTNNAFVVTVSPTERTGHRGGRLFATVLRPEDAEIRSVGGKGFEFFVDGSNYDEGGDLRRAIAQSKDAEPGSWRIELSPSVEREDDVFLVVALPTLGDAEPRARVRSIEKGIRFGCEVIGSSRTLRWWFSPDENGVDVEIWDRPGGTYRRIRTRQ